MQFLNKRRVFNRKPTVLYTGCSLLESWSYLRVIAAGRHCVQDCLGFPAGLVQECSTETHQARSEQQVAERVEEENVSVQSLHFPA